jgi:hypothetical protein
MNYELSDNKKKVLRALAKESYEAGMDMFVDVSREELNAASEQLKEYGLILVDYQEENEGVLYSARITDKGMAYIKANPTLENPPSENELKRLQIKVNRLQIDELEYKKKIRKQENIIHFWRLISAILGIGYVIKFILHFFKIV